ncbi:G-protein coupled receptor-associated protein LMBRD2-like [Biomphalaria glabrata]|uniref:G-protein coupled receptor-associated protein LMBRD2-like n=1 Tax=Biomphalaria glabrata TaxID=6526 RepID=A0A9W3AFS5_BIOGL|nr:G-protein coupled receptor-associated protein LMBRD2-like [Biomphalaria glabrata]XP_055886081.1 G-protein coupled receptor-associated protein LMBRD2-like [Biomphalaria glabrata]XP_055886082.1 G-protein coupled receptor-associated protein LMBRD2-like [Biomphalaria glabrata]XP_055886083.1 G-protein coupled receptor-associated protein LMBRD2-like [Biomphalaria glabrata]
MSAGPLVVEIIFTCALAAFLLHRYGDLKKQHLLITICCFISWYFSLMIIFILPLDVSLTFYRQCVSDHTTKSTTVAYTTLVTNSSHLYNITTNPQAYVNNNEVASSQKVSEYVDHANNSCEQPASYIPDQVLPILWRIIYWTSQVLTWLIMPMMQSYAKTGDFTVLGKIKSALIENAIFYGTYLLIFGICLIYVAAHVTIDGEKLKIIGVTASNTWGLFVLVLMLGYGLVDVPRSLWNKSKKGYTLSNTYFKIAKLSTEKTEAEEALEDVLEETRRTAEKIRYNHPLRKHMDTILTKCPESTRQSVRGKNDDFEDFNQPQDILCESTLVKLHKKVIRRSQIQRRTSILWANLINNALEWEDIDANMQNSERKYRHSDLTKGVYYFPWIRKIYNPAIEWYWICLVRPYVYMVGAGVLTIVSFMVVWSECLFFIKEPVLSLFAVFINLARENYDYVYIELASVLTIAYLCFCAYFSVFKIRVLNLYYIAPHHQTNEHSLIFIGMMLCRLTPPMCLNFLGLIHLDSHIIQDKKIEETSYTRIMGHMDVIAIISNGFNIYFPILIVLLCICTYFHLGNRILSAMGFQQFIGDDDMTQELINEGKELVAREKRKMERKNDAEARRKTWTERFGEASSNKDVPLSAERRERYTVPRSPDEDDRSELLRSIEPVDFREDAEDGLYAGGQNYGRGMNRNENGGYQSRLSRPTSSRPSGRAPKGIFDDV